MKAFNPSKELKPKKYKKLKIAIPIIIAVIVSVMIGYSLANYSVYYELQVIDAVVGEFSTGLNLAKDCSGQAAGKCLSQLGEDKYGNQIAKDTSADQNPRYIGATPDNYVEFNGELWRIIGTFDTYVCDDGTTGKLDGYKSDSNCKQEKLLKIIRNDFLSTSMAWDTNNANDWSTATSQTALNGDYFGKSGSYSSNGLNPTAQSMVANVVWTLGGTADYTKASNGLASHFYGYERGDTVYSGRPKAFVGHVGLMFPSDYGYATGGGTTYKRDACLAKEMFNWDGSSECYNNDWLFNSSYTQWTLSPNSGSSDRVFLVGTSGIARGDYSANRAHGVWPVVYLKSDVQITGGAGKEDNPYKLGYPRNAVEVVEGITDANQIAKDTSTDQNPRYIGADPNNYVEFNGETWRIIGVFNTYVCNDGTSGVMDNYKTNSACKQKKVLKIIKSDSLGSIAWDENDVNDWSNASLQKTLNGDYFGNTGTYSSNGLSTTAQGMVANVVWTLGGTASYTSESNGLASHFYGYERGETVYSGRPKAFVGKVGLMYPSDYGYATGGGTTYNRATCLAKEILNWESGSYKTDCAGGSWLFNSSYVQWTLSPRSGSSDRVFYVDDSGYVTYGKAHNTYGVRPVVYLNSDVKIMGGTGESGDPYQLSYTPPPTIDEVITAKADSSQIATDDSDNNLSLAPDSFE